MVVVVEVVLTRQRKGLAVLALMLTDLVATPATLTELEIVAAVVAIPGMGRTAARTRAATVALDLMQLHGTFPGSLAVGVGRLMARQGRVQTVVVMAAHPVQVVRLLQIPAAVAVVRSTTLWVASGGRVSSS